MRRVVISRRSACASSWRGSSLADAQPAAQRARLYTPIVHSFGIQRRHHEGSAIGRLQTIYKCLRLRADGSVQDDAILAHVDEVGMPGGVVRRLRRAIAQPFG